jgi:hypothetical protein
MIVLMIKKQHGGEKSSCNEENQLPVRKIHVEEDKLDDLGELNSMLHTVVPGLLKTVK